MYVLVGEERVVDGIQLNFNKAFDRVFLCLIMMIFA